MNKSLARALSSLILLPLVAALGAGVRPAQEPIVPEWRFNRISAADAKALEEGLKKNPDDLTAREKLIVYYYQMGIDARSLNLGDHWEQHVFWLIENHPESQLAGSPEATSGFLTSPDGSESYQHAKQLWLDQTVKHSDDIRVLLNASKFLSPMDRKIGKDLLDKAYNLDPNNSETISQLAQWYNGEWIFAHTREEKQAAARKALSFRERLIEKANAQERFYALDEVAKDAYEAGDNIKAEQYATELLQSAEMNKSDWNYGNAIHIGNIVLGRIALQRSDVAGAGQRLLAAGNVTGSPQLDSFGPDMSLAKELFEKGDHDSVLAYLQLCEKFWKMDEGRLQRWIAIIKGGGTPDFDSMP